MATRAAGTPRPQTAAPVGARRAPRPPAPRPPRRRGAGAFAVAAALLRRGAMFGLALAVLALFVAGVVEQRWKEARLREQVAAQQAILRDAEARRDALKAQLAATSDEARRAWVEATARRQLNLAYPGETVYLVNWTAPPAKPAASPAPEATPAPQPAAEPGWRHWWRMLTGD